MIMRPYRAAALAAAIAVLGIGGAAKAALPGSSAPTANGGPTVNAIYRGIDTPVHSDVSPPLRSMVPLTTQAAKGFRDENERGDLPPKTAPSNTVDSVLQSRIGAPSIPGPIINFDSTIGCGGCAPPDPNGEVGPNNYVAMGNSQFQIFNKTGTSLFGPANINTLFAGFGGACQTENSGDPVVLYDQLADRWLLSQFTSAGPNFFNCVALSTTGDPTGTYNRYAFTTGTNFPDYPKYGMSPTAYFISTREFQGSSGPFQGVGAYALNRTQMLAGSLSPQVISFLAPPTPAYVVGDGLLPADFDGTLLPPAGSDEVYMGSQDDNGSYGAPSDGLTFWKFHVDFATPANSNFTLATTLATAPFNSVFSPCGGTRACIPQPGTTNKLDILSYRQRPLFRLAYRNMGTYESLLTNQSVDGGAGPSGRIAGVRWYEVRSPSTTPVIFQQGTYAPGVTDDIHRWMGSMAMDHVGNIGLGYSVSNATVFPGIRYTGRLDSDPLGTLPQGEGTFLNGTGSQTGGGNRWGDYTDMTVDPTDDCTFWFVSEYVPTTSAAGWRIHVGSFKFPNCVVGTATPTVTGTLPTATTTSTVTQTSTPSQTATRTLTPTITPTQNPCLIYTVATSTGAIVPGTTNTGSACDDCSTSITLPFAVQLYGQSYTTASLSSNGQLNFGAADSAFTNTCLPDAATTYTIFPYWDDQRTDTAGSGIFTAQVGTTFYIEWRTTLFTGGTPENYEVVLTQGSPNFQVIYGSTITDSASETIGVQDAGIAPLLQYKCSTASPPITAGLQLSFTYSCGTPTATVTGTPPTATATRTSTAAPTSTATVTQTSAPATNTATATQTILPVINTSTATSVPSATRTIVATATPCTIQFTDVQDQTAYYYQGVYYLACRGVISGYSDNTFKPFNNTTRAQMTKIVTLAFNLALVTPPATGTFADVDSSSVFYQLIETAAARGLVSGYTCGGINPQTGTAEPCTTGNRPYFRPSNFVTRGQLAKIVVLGAAFPLINPAVPSFTDVATDNVFYQSIETAVCHGIISGYNDNTYRPNSYAFRGQIAKIVYLAVTNPLDTCPAVTPAAR